MLIIIYIAVSILFLVSFLHVYWAFGGKWATNSVIPTKDGEKGVYTRCRNDIDHCVIIKYGSNNFITTN